jgi:hypothetical protein
MTPDADGADVPARYRGVWRRTLLETPDGRDTTTAVHWLQTARWHADLRIPAERAHAFPPCSRHATERTAVAAAAAAWTPAQHRALAQQHGFFGRTEVQSQDHGGVPRERCTWHRHLDLQPPAATPDAGWMEFTSADQLIETGVHGRYREVWERLPESIGSCTVLSNDAGAVWLRSGAVLMQVRPRHIGWPADTTPADSLATVVWRHPQHAAALLDFEISYGTLRAGVWSVHQSTLPAREGSTEAWQARRIDAALAVVTAHDGSSRWRVREWSGAS